MLARPLFGSTVVACSVAAWTVTAAAQTTTCRPTPGRPVVTLTRDIQPILNERCVVCHIKGAENAELNLQPSTAFQNLIDKPSTESKLKRVARGDPEQSYIVHKLRGTHVEVGGSGERMPMGQEPLSQDQISKIIAWIASCATR